MLSKTHPIIIHFVLHDKNTFCIFNPSKRNIDS
nr:MAG TPA: hypothetical protein [Caudoviricetes sp.]